MNNFKLCSSTALGTFVVSCHQPWLVPEHHVPAAGAPVSPLLPPTSCQTSCSIFSITFNISEAEHQQKDRKYNCGPGTVL